MTIHLPFVYGYVTSQDGEPLGEVGMTISGTSVGHTNDDGFFNVTLPNRNSRIPIRYGSCIVTL